MNCEFPEGTTEHPINRNRENKLLVSVWDFGPKGQQSERKYYLCNDHPAKMRPTLARAILQVFGESPVLDPMAGIGTTLVEAMLLGMDAIGVEYEKKFADQANSNIQHVEGNFDQSRLGNAVCLHGDARSLEFLNKTDYGSILLSPPYANALDGAKHYRIRNGSKVYDKITNDKNLPKAYSLEDNDNIGNISEYGKFNSILFSPPYGEQHGKGGSIFNADGSVTDKFNQKFASSGIRRKGFLDVSSSDNIDNFRYSGIYLSEMLKVYSECYRVLASGKFMVVVVRDIKRNSLTIPLGADTIKLCQSTGFQLFDIIINKTYFPSFWALNRAKKDYAKGIMHPLRNHEYILVFRK
ncbi:MAG: DNA methyltransferase [Candidatus Bathyarchaeia archaeon]